MEFKKTRGPATKSCLTCKRRHKKCDLKRPKCDRCIKGGYECAYGPCEKPMRPKATKQTNDTENTQPKVYPCPASDVSDQSTSSSSCSPDLRSESATIEFLCNSDPVNDPFPPANQLVLANRQQSLISPHVGFDISVPFGLSHMSTDSMRMISYLMDYFDRMLCEISYFKPIEQQSIKYREMMLTRLKSSSISRRIALVSFKLHEAINKGDDWRYQGIFSQWVIQFENELYSMWEPNMVPEHTKMRLFEALEISYLKTMLVSNESSYPVLRFAASTFLQAVYADPTLWPPNHSGTSISMARVLSSIRCELANFIVMDVLYSMSYGLPQLVEYDTSLTPLPDELYTYSWAHGCPTEFQIALAEINACRDGLGTKDWRTLEQGLLSWESKPSPQEAEWESWMIVAWLAVQESWRHALLAYLYMALCGVSSDDPRVRSSVRQVLRIVKTVKQPAQPVASVHFFAQYFIAGVCARTEAQRTLVREGLTNMSGSRNWLVHGNIFVPVLEHLWTGAGNGGRPAKWEDYVHSRRNISNAIDVDQPARASVARSHPRILPKPTENENHTLLSTSSGLQNDSPSFNDSLSLKRQPNDMAWTSRSYQQPTHSGSNTSNKSVVVSGASALALQRMVNLHNRLPHSIPDPFMDLDGQWLVGAVIARFESIMSRWTFKPAKHRKEAFFQAAIQRLCNSKSARLITFVSVNILESILTGDLSETQRHSTWIHHIESSLKHELAHDLAPLQMRDRRSALVHISLVKTRIAHSSEIYRLLRSITPAFLQVAYSNPTLWSNDCDFTRIPLLNILTSEPHELAMFVLMDCTYAMVSGLPQQVEYDTMYSQSRTPSSPQWVHNSPTEFQLVPADINASRDKSLSARDWKDIERRLLTWQSPPGEYPFEESWMMVAWYAVQESWRLLLLIYLYLAVCDASSDDPRIQLCVKQILQVVGTVKRRGPPHADVSFFPQYMMAGICARSEKHRQQARDGLLYSNEIKLWLMRASDFTQVLDHLWHGAASGGRAIKWSDYVHSREAVLPIAM